MPARKGSGVTEPTVSDEPRSVAVFVGKRITHLRERRGWSTYRLAQQAGLSESYLGRIERGRHDPSLTTLLKLTAALDLCSIEELLAGARLGTIQALEAVEDPAAPVT